MPAPRTMYMHTIDGKPASYTETHGPYIHFAGGRYPAVLVPTLAQIRREQRRTIAALGERPGEFRYGYSRVTVPA